MLAMHPSFRFMFVLAFLLFCLQAMAQQTYRTVHWGLDEGLSQGEVNSMRKDVKGFLWVSSRDGLNRFDGSTFKHYYFDPQKPGTILGSNLLGIVEDSLHNLWFGTDKGISRYSIQTEDFINFRAAPKSTSEQPIIPFWATSTDVYCVETDSQLTKYDIHSFKKTSLLPFTPADSARQGPPSYICLDTQSNSVWMLYRGGLLEISLSTGRRQIHPWPWPFPHQWILSESMCFDPKRRCIWLNCLNSLAQFTLQDKQFHVIDALNQVPDLKDANPNFGHWVGITLDLQGRIWLPTVRKGIVIYNPATQSVSIPFPDDPERQKETSDFGATVYCDRDGLVWTGYWQRKGIYQLIPYAPAVTRFTANPAKPNSLHNNTVFGAVNSRGKIWLGSQDGLHIFDPTTKIFQVLLEKDLPGIKGNFIIPIQIDTVSNKAWLVAPDVGGCYEMDLTTHQCRPIRFKNQANQFITPLRQGRMVPFRDGIIGTAFYADKESIVRVSADSTIAHEVLSFPTGTINYIYTTTIDDRLLFLSRLDNSKGNLTYQYLNGKWVQLHTPLDRISWNAIVYNSSDKTYWVVANRQLLHYNANFGIIRTYTQQDGLPDIPIYELGLDRNGNVWFNTDRSIHQLNAETGTVSNLSEKDGLQKQSFTPISGYKTLDDYGNIYFTAGHYGAGFDQINPAKYISTATTVYLQSLTINQKPFRLPKGLNNLQELDLRYDENTISIETGVIDYYSKGSGKIRYKLESLAITWDYAPSNYTIRYDGLAPGHYKLVIQASNASNEFNGPERIVLITISHPWWQTWWAYVSYLLIISGAIWVFIQYRSKALRRQNYRLEEKVTQRTAEVVAQKEELHKTLTELKDTQTQLIQREKMASLGELTAGIAHEIQNPLNFVTNFAEVSIELADELAEEQEKGRAGIQGERNEALETNLLDDLRTNMKHVVQNGNRAAGIVRAMLEHSRTSVGERVSTNLNALADEYLKLAYHGIRAKSPSFTVQLDTNFDPTLTPVELVPQDIGRVLLNLYNNAFYAVQQKQLQRQQTVVAGATDKSDTSYQPQVWVSTRQVDSRIELIVRDNGTGISDQIKAKIFQPFFTTKPTGQGTGLGLSLSYDIVSKGHNGQLTVESQPGKGTTFTLHLPIH